MQPVPVEDLEESEALIEAEAPRALPRRALLVSSVLLGLVVLVGVALQGGPGASPGTSSSTVEDVVMMSNLASNLAATKCLTNEQKCKGCGGEQCSACEKTRKLECCLVDASGDADKVSACCTNEDYLGANREGLCGATCKSFDDRCKGCSGKACTGCKKEGELECCISKAKTDDDKKACCTNKDYDGVDKSACAGFLEQAQPDECSAAGAGCMTSRCCKDKKLTCFKKNDYWADCKESCQKGKVDPNTPVEYRAPWACSWCSKAGEGCLNTGCCADKSLTCFVKNQHWADCKKECKAGEVDPDSPKKDQSAWACTPRCSKPGEGCMKTGCCQDRGHFCFKKDEHWADCKTSCKAGESDPNTKNESLKGPWNCSVLDLVPVSAGAKDGDAKKD